MHSVNSPDRSARWANASLTLSDTAEKLAQDGVAPAGGTPEQFAATIAREVEVWKRLAAEGAIKAE